MFEIHARGWQSSLALVVTNNQCFVPKTNFSFYIMTKVEKKTYLHVIKKLKTPTNYVESLKTKVQKEAKLWGLKSHDCHILIQQIFPLCICTLMEEEVQMSLISLSQMFNQLYIKVIDPNNIDVLKVKVVETKSTLEKVFLPTCFDVMTHLVVHLVKELIFVA